MLLAGACIIAKSQGQKNITLSTAEAELVAASEAVKEAEWLRLLLCELGIENTGPMPFWIDNTATIDIIKNAANHPATKHIEIRNLYVRDVHDKGHITVNFCRSEDQVADILTKALPRHQFERLRTYLGVKEVLPCDILD